MREMNTKTQLDDAALRYHSEGRPGKIGIVPTKPYHTQYDLSLAYSPGVAAPSLAIAEEPDDVYKYTGKGNLVAVISNGTAVLGLGNIGPLAAKPVMEGKSMLFKTYAGIDAFDIEVDTTDPEEFIRTVKAIAPTFGGINLEDIKAPECFEIETRLREELDIPLMHDDQHGTAIISSAALLNGAKIAGKELDKMRVVVNGAGAAAIACARLFVELGIRRENMVLCDSHGAVTVYREDINPMKREFATTRRITTLAEALHDADVFLGVSKADTLTPEMLRLAEWPAESLPQGALQDPAKLAGRVLKTSVLRGEPLGALDKKLRQLDEKLARRHVCLHLTPEAHEWLLKEGFKPEYGAREMDRAIAAHLKPLLMREILFGSLKQGGDITVTAENNQLSILK